MRSLLLILATVVGIVLLAVAYVSLQAPTPKVVTNVQVPTTRSAPRPPPQATTDESMPVLKSGDDVWVSVPDNNGGTKWEFRAARHDPRPDNSVDVVKPQARFYFNNGQIVTLDGTRGRVIIPAATAQNTDFRSGMLGPPSRGELYDVTISMFDASDPETPVMVSEMNNVSFDNNTFRIATESFTQPDGTVVPADQVPVKVRGKATDFDGRGLTIQWNDRDRRLEMMEIAHGESMTIKTLGAPSPSTRPTATVSEVPERPAPAAPARGRPPARTGRARGPATPAPIAAAPTTQKLEPPTYRATFHGGDSGVKVTQRDQNKVDQTVATAETMQVDFKSQADEPTPRPAPPPPPPPPPGRRGARRGPAPAPQPVRPAPPPAPTTQRQNPTTRGLFSNASSGQPGEPYVIHWQGKLTVVPIEESKPPLQPGQQIVRMISGNAPVVLHHLGNEIQCASFVYNDADGGLVVSSSPQFPEISMKDEAGKMLFTPSLVYSATTGKGLLEGRSRAEFPLVDDNNQVTGVMKTSWSKSCELTLTGESSDQMTIQQALIIGDVKVEHPQLKMQSETLRAEFAPPAAKDAAQKQGVQPKSMVAEGGVKCDIIQPDQKVQHVTSDRLELTTRTGPDGKITPDRVMADGNVHTFDDAQEQDLRAGQLEATLAPTTQPSDVAKIDRLIAREDVRFAASGSSGTANRLEVETDPKDRDEMTLTLVGTVPPAKIASADSTLIAQDITIHQNQPKNQQSVLVRGAGTLSGTQKQSANEKATPFELTWSKDLDFNTATNLGKVNGAVMMTTVTSDGAKNTMSGEHLTMVLADDPTAAAPTTSTTKPDGSPTAVMGKKILQSMLLDEGCEIKSIMADADGNLLRRLHLFGPKIQVENQDGQNWRMVVPDAGNMLMDDRRPTTHPSGAATGAPLGDMNGATAFEWKKQLVYDQSKNTAEMLGDVRIVHPAPDGVSEPFRIEAQRVAAEFEMDTTKKPATEPSTKPADDQKIKLKMLTAEDQVWFQANNIEFVSYRMTFDPVSQTIDAQGAPGIPMQIYGKNSTAGGSWQRATWNTQTQKVVLSEGQTLVPR